MIDGLNESVASGLASGVFSSIMNVPGISTILKIVEAAGYLFIVYLVFLIFKAIIQTKQSFRLKKIANNVEDINKKLDILTGKKGKK